MYSASYGHAFRHALQPMHRSGSKSTIPPKQRRDRADLHTGRVVAVVAAQDREVPTGVGEGALLDVLHPRTKDAELDPVLLLAGDRTRVAADARALIQDETEARHARQAVAAADFAADSSGWPSRLHVETPPSTTWITCVAP